MYIKDHRPGHGRVPIRQIHIQIQMETILAGIGEGLNLHRIKGFFEISFLGRRSVNENEGGKKKENREQLDHTPLFDDQGIKKDGTSLPGDSIFVSQ